MIYYPIRRSSDRATFAAIRRINLDANPHTMELRFTRPVSGTAYLADRCIIAIPLQ
jgi:hypothetical protein